MNQLVQVRFFFVSCHLGTTTIGSCMRFFVVHAVHEQMIRSSVSAVKFIVTFLEKYNIYCWGKGSTLLLNLLLDAVVQDGLDYLRLCFSLLGPPCFSAVGLSACFFLFFFF